MKLVRSDGIAHRLHEESGAQFWLHKGGFWRHDHIVIRNFEHLFYGTRVYSKNKIEVPVLNILFYFREWHIAFEEFQTFIGFRIFEVQDVFKHLFFQDRHIQFINRIEG